MFCSYVREHDVSRLEVCRPRRAHEADWRRWRGFKCIYELRSDDVYQHDSGQSLGDGALSGGGSDGELQSVGGYLQDRAECGGEGVGDSTEPAVWDAV